MKQRFLIAAIVVLVLLFFAPVYAQDGIDTLIELFERGLRISGESHCESGDCSYDFTVRVADVSTPVNTSSPTPTPTTTPTSTSTTTPTATPTSTNTPTPTATSTSTNTPVSTNEPPTPTPEITVLPPTFTFTPEPKECVIKVGSNAINERTDHFTTAPKTSTSPIPAGSIVVVEEFWQEATNPTYLWGKNVFGWFVVGQWTNSVISWWVYGTSTGTELCDEVSGWPAGLDPPVAIVYNTEWGVLVTQGANTQELLQFGEQLKAAGIQPAATIFGYSQYANDLKNAGWTVGWRPFIGDCPGTGDPVQIARDRWSLALSMSEGVQYDYLLLNNECGWPDVWWYKSYLSETINLAEAARIKIVPNIFNSGAPELSWFGILYPEHQKLRDIGGMFGYNSYPVREGMSLCSNDDYATWTTFRYERFSLPPGLGIYVAEFARSWGEMEPDFNDVECYVKRVDGDFSVITKWYDAMPLYPWENATVRGKLNQLADVYIRALDRF